MDKVSCRLCGGRAVLKFIVMNSGQSFPIHECAECGFQFRDIAAADAYRYYDEGYYTGKSGFTYLDERQMEAASRIVWKARINKLSQWDYSGSEDRRYLDVGCAFGGLMQVAQEAGYEPYGAEVSSYSGEYAGKRFGDGHIHIGNIEEIQLPQEYYSLITMVEVVEHLYDPRKALENLCQSLKPGGLLLVQTADMAGMQAVKGGAKYHYYLPGHLSYFNRHNLEKLLLECGFRETRFIGGVEFGLLPKLRKSRYSFKKPSDYLKWFQIAWYHYLSKLVIGGIHQTSSMVILAWK